MNFSDIPPLGSIDDSSDVQADFLLVRESCDEYSIYVPSNVTDVFKLEMRGLNTLGKQCQVLHCGVCLCGSAQASTVGVRLLQRQLETRPAALKAPQFRSASIFYCPVSINKLNVTIIVIIFMLSSKGMRSSRRYLEVSIADWSIIRRRSIRFAI